jgi:KDO2-lipid IV(A) lauroyltransferase
MSQFIGTGIYWVLRILGKVFKKLPYPLYVPLGVLFACVFCLVAPHRVLIARDNLKLVFPQKSSGWRWKVFFRSMLHFGLNLWEWMWMPAMNASDFQKRCYYVNKPLEELIRRHGGLVLSAHIGNWEFMTAMGAYHVCPMAIIYRYFRQPWLETLWVKTRESHRIELIPESRSAFQVLRKLGSRFAVGVMLDQHVGPPEGIVVPFFGLPVSTASGLAVLQMRTHQYVFPVVCFRDWKTGKFKIVLDGKISPETRSLEEYQHQVHDLTAQYHHHLEKWITQHPDQWLWIHRRFKYAYDYAKHKQTKTLD